MKILKYKKVSKDKYEIVLDNKEKISLYEDIIVKYNLLLKKEIDNELLDSLLTENNNYNAYNIALKYITVRLRSEKEIKEYLIKKNISNNLIEIIISKLIKDGYLDDERFAKAYFHDQLNLSLYGPFKIKRNLIELGVKEDIIDNIIKNLDSNIINEKLTKLINKQVKLKKGSLSMLKVKLLNYFYNLGYDKESILSILSTMDLKTDISYLEKEYKKIYNRYNKKYEDKALKQIIINKLLFKGYLMEDINKLKMED